VISRLSFAEGAVFHCGGERAEEMPYTVAGFICRPYATGVRFICIRDSQR